MTPEEFVPPDPELEELLRATKTIAVVGLSDNPMRPSHGVAYYLYRNGYRVIPVNPKVERVWDLKAFPDLESVRAAGIQVDLVDVFRRSEEVPPVVDEAIRVGAKAIWLQEGVVHEAAAAKARDAGLQVVMDRCAMKEHARLVA